MDTYDDEWKPRSRGFQGRKRYGIQQKLKTEIIEKRRQWHFDFSTYDWSACSWYETEEDREKALAVLQRKDTIFDYKRIDR